MPMSWRRSRLAGAALAAALLAAPALAAKPALCPGGAYQVEEAAGPLVPGGAAPDLLQIGDDGAVSIASGCPEVAGKLKATKKGTTLRAKWSRKKGLCNGLPNKTSLRARFDPSCETLSGKFRSKGVKVAFTAQRAGIALDGKVPASIHGEPLAVGHASGNELVAEDAGWADTFAALGTSAGGVEIQSSTSGPDSALDLRVLVFTAPGAGWAQRLADLAAAIAAHPESGYSAESQSLGGRDVWKLGVPGSADYHPAYYVTDGDVLFVLGAADEGLAGEVLAALPLGGAAPLSASAPRGDPPAPGSTFLVVRELLPVNRPVCVAEPYNTRVTVQLMALDGYYQVPVLAIFALLSHAVGETSSLAEAGPVVSFFYRADTFGSPEQLMFQAVAPAGGQGASAPIVFPVRHCLNGTWQDADRVLQIDHVFDQVTANIQSGTLCEESGGVAFTGKLGPAEDHFSGSDLKVCNYDECVKAGLQEPSAVTDYQATVASDGNSVQFDWESGQIDLVYDGNGKLIACNPNGDVQPRSFSISRLTFGPNVP
jgi:hypothetical protein